MHALTEIILTDLRYLIADLGAAGGIMSPSIYDTAQVIRLAPPKEGIWPAVDWLLEQQHADGGWGDPAVPRARDLPTLATLLALRSSDSRQRTRDAIREGELFLRRQAIFWTGGIPDDLTAGAELLLPTLFEEAVKIGMKIDTVPYHDLIALGNRRRALIARYRPSIGTTPLHSWEAWGDQPDLDLVDPYGSIGHSPAATARWIHDSQGNPENDPARTAATSYLEQAAAASGVNIPGVVPTCWPIPRFEQAFGIHGVYLAGLIDHPGLAEVVQPQISDLARSITPAGIGLSDTFAPDGDDTAATIAVLHATGRPVDIQVLQQFANKDHFCAWHGELQPSLSVTAHAIHTLRLLGHDTTPYEHYIITRQCSDGRWPGDKWNGSWLYTTWRCVIALHAAGHTTPIRRAVSALLTYQHADGGWGSTTSNPEETAYATLMLRSLIQANIVQDDVRQSLQRGDRWLQQQYRPFVPSTVACWLGKEPYRPQRVSRVIELTALLKSLNDLPNSMR
ncbi:hypothetical protein EKD04_020265 [Chloroflexales bacterium ZM16-3]|nr:hypothetical protein [Chloroflexales bacterium ZM16-3]